MALIKCTECGHMISDKATRCPKCGCPVSTKNLPQANDQSRPMQNAPTTGYIYDENRGKGHKWLYTIIAFLVVSTIGLGYMAWENGFFGDNNNSKEAVILSDTIEASHEKDIMPENKMESRTATAEKNVAPAVEQPQKLKVTKVEFGYYLAPQAGNTYEPSNMCDGNPSTAWAVGLYDFNPYTDSFWGPIFTVKCKKLSHIIIRNGYCKNNNSYKNNARTTGISFLNFEDHSVLYEGLLKDTPKPQRLDISSDSQGSNDIEQVGISFFDYDFIPGAKWNDLCISEVEFWGYM